MIANKLQCVRVWPKFDAKHRLLLSCLGHSVFSSSSPGKTRLCQTGQSSAALAMQAQRDGDGCVRSPMMGRKRPCRSWPSPPAPRLAQEFCPDRCHGTFGPSRNDAGYKDSKCCLVRSSLSLPAVTHSQHCHCRSSLGSWRVETLCSWI